jgi:replicative DNA helicase
VTPYAHALSDIAKRLDGAPIGALRLPPQDLEAEQALLGALISNNKAFEKVQDFLAPEHFADPVHARIFGVIQRRVMLGELADVVVLRTELAHDEELASAGGVEYLVGLVAATIGILNAGEYGKLIHECWLRREALRIGAELVEAAHNPRAGATAADTIDAGAVALHDVALGNLRAGRPVTAAAAGDAVLANLQAAMQRSGGLVGLPWGYAALDRMTGGMRPGQLIVLGARPSMGKTALGMGIAARAAATIDDGRQVMVLSAEMPASDIQARLVAAEAHMPLSAVERGGWQPEGERWRRFSQAEFDRVYEAKRRLDPLPLAYLDDRERAWPRIAARLRSMHRRHPMALLVVDYIGLLRSGDEGRHGLTQGLTEISAGMKALALELRIPILALSQLNRANEAREDKRPTLADLRQSGSIEQDADVVGFLHREHYYLKNFPPVQKDRETAEQFSARNSAWFMRMQQEEGRAEVILAKNRQGATGPVRLRWAAEQTWFWDEADNTHASAVRPVPRTDF